MSEDGRKQKNTLEGILTLMLLNQRTMSEQLGDLQAKMDALEGVPGTLGTVEQAVSELTPLVQEAVEYLRNHPDIRAMSVRQAAEETPYSKSTIGRAKKFIEENDESPAA